MKNHSDVFVQELWQISGNRVRKNSIGEGAFPDLGGVYNVWGTLACLLVGDVGGRGFLSFIEVMLLPTYTFMSLVTRLRKHWTSPNRIDGRINIFYRSRQLSTIDVYTGILSQTILRHTRICLTSYAILSSSESVNVTRLQIQKVFKKAKSKSSTNRRSTHRTLCALRTSTAQTTVWCLRHCHAKTGRNFALFVCTICMALIIAFGICKIESAEKPTCCSDITIANHHSSPS